MMEPIVIGHSYIVWSHDLYYFTHTSDLVGLLYKTPVFLFFYFYFYFLSQLIFFIFTISMLLTYLYTFTLSLSYLLTCIKDPAHLSMYLFLFFYFYFLPQLIFFIFTISILFTYIVYTYLFIIHTHISCLFILLYFTLSNFLFFVFLNLTSTPLFYFV